MRRRLLPLVAASALALGLSAGAAGAAESREGGGGPGLRDVMFVGNNWDGTITLVDAHSHEVLRTGVDLIPDREQEMADILAAPDKAAFFYAIRFGPGEGNDQFVDDLFTTHDGRYLAVSRPSFADVIWVDVADLLTGEGETAIVHEEQMDGYRTDHMGVSPDGRRLLVSDSTERQVIEYSMVDETLGDGTEVTLGQRLRSFESGETPHENNYTVDGSRIYHASIGKVYTPGDFTQDVPVLPTRVPAEPDSAKGDRWFQVVDEESFEILRRWDMRRELAESGFDGYSSAVRPMAFTKDERFLYFQVSFFHGLVEFDTTAPDADPASTYTLGGVEEPSVGAVTRVLDLPNRVPLVPRETYVNDSAHHGLAISEDDSTLCVAGTMSDYAALVDRETFETQIFDEETTGNRYGKPYWSTEGPDETCWVSLSDSDAAAVLDVATGEELAYLPVGNHPQRIRLGWVDETLLAEPAAVVPETPLAVGIPLAALAAVGAGSLVVARRRRGAGAASA